MFALSACSDTPKQDITGLDMTQSLFEDEGPDDKVYDQVEFLGNPLVSEVTIVTVNHDASNRTQPYNSVT